MSSRSSSRCAALLRAEAGFTPHAAIRSTQTAAVPRLVAAGLGVGLVPSNILTSAFPGTVLCLAPRRHRPLAVFTRAAPHPLISEFVTTARHHAHLMPEHLAGRSPRPQGRRQIHRFARDPPDAV